MSFWSEERCLERSLNALLFLRLAYIQVLLHATVRFCNFCHHRHPAMTGACPNKQGQAVLISEADLQLLDTRSPLNFFVTTCMLQRMSHEANITWFAKRHLCLTTLAGYSLNAEYCHLSSCRRAPNGRLQSPNAQPWLRIHRQRSQPSQLQIIYMIELDLTQVRR